jgi:CPA1 family monovalent cation:H+ antiporter
MKARVLPRVLAGIRRCATRGRDTIEQTMIIQRRYLDCGCATPSRPSAASAYSSATYRQVEALLDSVEQRTGAT